MKKSLRICSLLLALVTALSCLLTGCGETENPESTSSVTTQAVGPENTETEYDPLANVNIKNLGGETYLLLTPSRDWAVTNLTVDDISGDVIQDTIYSRQLKAEELVVFLAARREHQAQRAVVERISLISHEGPHWMPERPVFFLIIPQNARIVKFFGRKYEIIKKKSPYAVTLASGTRIIGEAQKKQQGRRKTRRKTRRMPLRHRPFPRKRWRVSLRSTAESSRGCAFSVIPNNTA